MCRSSMTISTDEPLLIRCRARTIHRPYLDNVHSWCVISLVIVSMGDSSTRVSCNSSRNGPMLMGMICVIFLDCHLPSTMDGFLPRRIRKLFRGLRVPVGRLQFEGSGKVLLQGAFHHAAGPAHTFFWNPLTSPPILFSSSTKACSCSFREKMWHGVAVCAVAL